jgi:predicted dehydrogenase
VDFQFTELETFKALKGVIDEGRLGRLQHASVTWLTYSKAQSTGKWSWKTDAAQGGGVLTLLGTHLLYLAEWLLGPAARVFSRMESRATTRLLPNARAMAGDDLLALTIEHHDGALLTAVVGNANPGLSIHRWIVVGDKGTAIVENEGRDYMAGFTLRIIDENGRIVASYAEPMAEGDGRLPPFRRLAARFIEAVRTGGTFRPDFADGARVAFLTDAVRRSAANGAYVDVSRRPA